MAAETRTPHSREVDDGLEPPTLDARVLVWIAVATPAFILVALALLAVFYQVLLKNPAREPIHPFPTPRLETNIEPRNMPATPEPGPAPPARKTAPVEPPAAIAKAMQAVVARGAHAYDPLPSVGITGTAAP